MVEVGVVYYNVHFTGKV